ncbi:MAG: ABC transporter ATP-binding protein, partial [Sulfolobales archaeon]|nr:ABC transporter ATP-binding protein [Sulfolobales archaeon]MDW8010767.1 ABC transporter ATP-binding protein [Sulfolobales archaeon]
VHKVYSDGTVALRGVNLEIREKEVLGLLGENGAGKTTLMKILSGFLKPTKGHILIDSKLVKFGSSRDALDRGIAMVHQIFTLVPNLTSLENIVLGYEARGGLLSVLKPMDYRELSLKVSELSDRLGLKVPLDVPVEKLSLGLRQRVEILKALYKGARVLILDEPTTFLTAIEVKELFKFIESFRESGGSVVFITHKIKEVLSIADRIVVLRKGLVSGEVPTPKATPELLAELMVGREVDLNVSFRSLQPVKQEKPVLKVENLWVYGDLGVPAVKGVSFEVYPGEIFGVAGVEGNGQDELVEALTGLRKPSSGSIAIGGVPVDRADALVVYKAGASHIPGDRERYGLAVEFPVFENSVIGRQWESSFSSRVWIRWSRVRQYAEEVVRRFNVITPSIFVPARALSGGNRQRLLVGRELTRDSKLIVAMHPTKGLDIVSTIYVRELLAKARNEGKAVLLVSADLEEILQLSNRMAVMYEGKFLAVGRAEDFTLEEIGMLMGGVVPGRLKTQAHGR